MFHPQVLTWRCTRWLERSSSESLKWSALRESSTARADAVSLACLCLCACQYLCACLRPCLCVCVFDCVFVLVSVYVCACLCACLQKSKAIMASKNISYYLLDNLITVVRILNLKTTHSISAPCPPGTYLSRNKCEFCPLHHYQGNSGQTSCYECVKDRGTTMRGSQHVSNCKWLFVLSCKLSQIKNLQRKKEWKFCCWFHVLSCCEFALITIIVKCFWQINQVFKIQLKNPIFIAASGKVVRESVSKLGNNLMLYLAIGGGAILLITLACVIFFFVRRTKNNKIKKQKKEEQRRRRQQVGGCGWRSVEITLWCWHCNLYVNL